MEYYTHKDWKALQEQARKDEANDQYNTPSVEIMEMIKERRLEVQALLGQKEKISASDQSELENLLNKYVGDNGEHTPLVKMVTVGIPSAEMRQLEVYDTPGVNDPVASREYETRSFMRSADVIFFLSQASKFLSENDMDLLSRQFPQEGVRKINLLGSQFDSALYQATGDSDSKKCQSLDELYEMKIASLTIGAEKICTVRSKQLGEKRGEILMGSLPPLFFSSRALMWQAKEPLYFTADEQWDYSQLESEAQKKYGANTLISDELINKMACRERIQALFDDSIENKEQIINDKIKDILPNCKNTIDERLKDFVKNQEDQLSLLEQGDLQELKKTQETLEAQIGSMGEAIEEELGTLAHGVKTELNSVLSGLQSELTAIAKVQIHQGSETKRRTEYYTVTKRFLFIIPYDVERSRRVSYTENYSYTTTADALESLMKGASFLAREINKGFQQSVDPKKTKFSLKRKIMDAQDTSSLSYNPTFYRLIVEEAVNGIEIPRFEISAEPFMETVKGLFTGEIRGDDLAHLRVTVLSTAQALFKDASERATRAATLFQNHIKKMKKTLQDKVIESSREKLRILHNDLDKKEERITYYKEGLSAINTMRKEL